MAGLSKSWQAQLDAIAARARPLADLATELAADALILNCGAGQFAAVSAAEHRSMIEASDAYPALVEYCERTGLLRNQVSYWWRTLYGARPYPL